MQGLAPGWVPPNALATTRSLSEVWMWWDPLGDRAVIATEPSVRTPRIKDDHDRYVDRFIKATGTVPGDPMISAQVEGRRRGYPLGT
jgi:hypothetical protein